MKQFFRNIWQHKRYIVLFGLFFALFSQFGDVFANTGDPTVPQASTEDQILKVFNSLIRGITYLIAPLVWFAGWLLSPDWTMGDIFGLRPQLNALWVLVSNIVYVIFALVLVVIAFANIFGVKSDTFALKQSLPRFLVGILLVPFSWFIVSATLSIVNFTTASVLQLPQDVISTTDNNHLDTISIPKNIRIDFSQIASGKEGDPTEQTADCKGVRPGEQPNNGVGECVSLSSVLEGKGVYNVLVYYAYGVFEIHSLKQLSKESLTNTIFNIGDLVLKLGFSVITAIIFAALIIALILALLARMTLLWLIIIFSPVFGLLYFLNGKAPDRVTKYLSFKGFMSLAVVPLYVGTALTFGIFILSGVEAGKDRLDPQLSHVQIEKVKNEDRIGANISFGDVTLQIFGDPKEPLKGGGGTLGQEWGLLESIASGGAGFFGQLILEIIAIVILWMATMAALKSNEITAAAVQPIEQIGAGIGKIAKDTPKYAPIIPIGWGKRASFASASQTVSTIQSGIQQSQTSAGSDIGRSFLKKYGIGSDDDRNGLTAIAKLKTMPKDSTMRDMTSELKNTIAAFNPQTAWKIEQIIQDNADTIAGAINKMAVGEQDKQALLDALKESPAKFISEWDIVGVRHQATGLTPDTNRTVDGLLESIKNSSDASVSQDGWIVMEDTSMNEFKTQVSIDAHGVAVKDKTIHLVRGNKLKSVKINTTYTNSSTSLSPNDEAKIRWILNDIPKDGQEEVLRNITEWLGVTDKSSQDKLISTIIAESKPEEKKDSQE